MKFFLPLTGLFLLSFAAKAQQPQAQNTSKIGCIDADTRLLVDEVSQHYAAQGFAVVRNAMLNMSSHQPFPVIIELSDKDRYQIAFVANKDATHMEAQVLGPDKKPVFSESNRIKKTGRRVISFPFKTQKTDAYLFILQQNLRHDETCGGFLMFRDTLKSRTVPVVPF